MAHHGVLIRICHHLVPVPLEAQRRVWLPLGEPVTVGTDAILTALQDSGDSSDQPYLEIQSGSETIRLPVNGTPFDCGRILGLHLIPLAVEYDKGNRRTKRIRVQFLLADEAATFPTTGKSSVSTSSCAEA